MKTKMQDQTKNKFSRRLGLASLVILIMALIVFGFVAFATTYAIAKERSSERSSAIISACRPVKEDVSAHSVCLATNSAIYSAEYNTLLIATLVATLVADGMFVLLLIATLNQVINLRR